MPRRMETIYHGLVAIASVIHLSRKQLSIRRVLLRQYENNVSAIGDVPPRVNAMISFHNGKANTRTSVYWIFNIIIFFIKVVSRVSKIKD